MNRKIKTLIISLLLLLLSAAFSGCGKTSGPAGSPGSGTAYSASVSTGSSRNGATSSGIKNTGKELKTFTKEELKKYDGQNGSPAYVAVDGVVYDVTNEKSWKGGKHKGVKAGADVTEAMKSSPHGLEPLKKLPVIGRLAG